jgi:hypothetical protein
LLNVGNDTASFSLLFRKIGPKAVSRPFLSWYPGAFGQKRARLAVGMSALPNNATRSRYHDLTHDELVRLLEARDRRDATRFGLAWEANEIERDKAVNADFVALGLGFRAVRRRCAVAEPDH